jgi:hypothetical protein
MATKILSSPSTYNYMFDNGATLTAWYKESVGKWLCRVRLATGKEWQTGNFDTLRDAVAWAHGQVGGNSALPQLP